MKLIDYHVHSNLSCDGKSSIFKMCHKAIELGIEEIGFSEHMDFEPTDWGYGFFNYEQYTSDIRKAQGFFKNQLVIRKGVEIDYQRCFEDEVKEWLQDKTFDFTIGSVHYLNHKYINRKLVESNPLQHIFAAYVQQVLYSINSRLFDVIGHFGLVNRYVENRQTELKSFNDKQMVRTLFEEIVKKKIYLEVNSKGLREPYNNTLPSKDTVNDFIKMGGNIISIGSDAHSIQELGSGIKEILALLENNNGNKFKLLFE